ncbi:MAG TPA: hypothetical protein VJH88_02535 [Candidatus Nanoarchaeia archaeon]|nr:hypothetical protein [Candidatus Nanoarchaeia archaeon]
MWTDNEIKGKILHKLSRFGKFEASHTAIENLQKGFPKDIVGRVKEMIIGLKKENVLFVKHTSYGEHVSINLDKKKLIMNYITFFLKNE